MSPRAWRLVLAAAALPFLVLAGWAAAHAPSFADAVADFGAENDHLIHDFAATSATFGIALLVAIAAPSWRTPILALAALWNGLHAVSHVVDIGAADPGIVGPIEAVALLATTVLLGWLAWLSAREQRR
jgi:hypothetical protein